MSNPYTDTYIMTLEQNGQRVTMTVTKEAMDGNPKWIFDEFLRQLSEKQSNIYEDILKAYERMSQFGRRDFTKSALFEQAYGGKPVKAEAVRLDKPAEIGPANGD